MATSTAKRPARKTPSRTTKSRARNSESAPVAARKAVRKVAKKATKAAASVERKTDRALDTGKKALASGLSTVQHYAEKGGRSLKAAGRAAQGYGAMAVKEVKRNPKLAGAIAAGVVSVGSALIVRQLNKGNNRARLTSRASQATQAITRKASQVGELVSEKIRELSPH